MQKIEYYTDPSPHIIIDNFLSDKMARACLKEAIELERHFKQSEPIHKDGEMHQDNCEECTRFRENFRSSFRDTSLVDLDEHFKGKRDKSIILSSIHDLIYKGIDFHLAIKDFPPPFNLLNKTTTTRQTLSRYGKCQFYGWHRDTDSIPQPIERVITIIYYFNKEPPTFKGGNLFFGGESTKNYKEVIPKHNRALIFESSRLHAVDTVKLSGNFDEGRFSINMWFGFMTGQVSAGFEAFDNMQVVPTDLKRKWTR